MLLHRSCIESRRCAECVLSRCACILALRKIVPVLRKKYEWRYNLRDSAARADRRGFDLISDALPFGKLWYDDVEAAASFAEFYSRSHPVSQVGD
jgi:hypothetical protein